MTDGSPRHKDIEFPERLSSGMLRDYLAGHFEPRPVIMKAVVLKIDHEGGKLAGSGAEARKEEPPNPRGSILGRVISSASDLTTPDDLLPVFWPFFPYDVMPVKEGEHIYVLFEDVEQRHGMWLTRIPEQNLIQDLNITPGSKRYTEDKTNDLEKDSVETERIVQDLEIAPKLTKVSEEFQKETGIPEFTVRVGDRVIQGSNNTAIILSRDRIDTVESGVKEKAGTIDVVAGRVGSDLNMADDASRMIITMKSDVDANFALDSFGEAAGEVAAIVAKSDEIRLVARNGLKIVVESGPTSVVIDSKGKVTIQTTDAVELTSKSVTITTDDDIVLDAGGDVKVGSADASHKIPKGDALKDFLKSVFDVLAVAPVDTAGIPAISIVNSAVKTAIDGIMSSYESLVLSDKNKVE
jgi:hypothetical protein